MSNSSLISYTQISPNRNSPRNHVIDTVTIHCVVGQLSVETMGNMFAQSSYQASCNYAIGSDGRIALIVNEGDRSWCSSNKENDHRAVTIECASDTTSPYAVNEKVYASLIRLLVDICQRNGIKKLLWEGDKSLIGQTDRQNMTVHRWFANKACPGDYLYNRHSQIAAEVNKKLGAATEETKYYRVRTSWENADSQLGAFTVLKNAVAACIGGYRVYDWGGNVVYENTSANTQASEFADLTEAQAAAKILELAQADAQISGILPSLTAGQALLESGHVRSELAVNANNCFGMKCSLSGNTWDGSTWDGESVYTKKTQEQDKDGNESTITADFRKYPCIEDSIADHSAYLLGAMNGAALRYAGLTEAADYAEAVTIVKNGGYATDTAYIEKVCAIIEKYDLDRYDEEFTCAVKAAEAEAEGAEDGSPIWYRVRTSWGEGMDGQVGAYHDLDKAKACADANPGYNVYDENGVAVYVTAAAGGEENQYTVQAGSFEVKANARKLKKQLIKAGFAAIVKKVDGNYIVQCGAFDVQANAEALRDKLLAAGFPAIIK